MNVYIIHENKEWIPPIRAALEKRGVEVKELDFSLPQSFDLNRKPLPGLYFNRVSPSAFSRSNANAPTQVYQFLNYLDFHQANVVNGASTVLLEVSKVKQHLALNQANILTPNVRVYTSLQALREGEHQYPFIMKYNSGGKGLGVTKIENDLMLEAYCQTQHQSIDGIYLKQDYIQSKEPYITRAEFIDGKFVYAVQIDNQNGFELCPSDVCQIGEAFCPIGEATNSKFTIIPTIDEALKMKYEQFLQVQNIQVAGIEFVTGVDGRTYTYDVNVNTNYNRQAEVVFGKSAYDVLAAYLKSQIEE